MDIIDLEREDLLRVPGIAAEQADNLLQLIESLTVEEGSSEEAQPAEGAPTDEELEEAKQLAADVLGLPMPERKTAVPPAEATEDAGQAPG